MGKLEHTLAEFVTGLRLAISPCLKRSACCGGW